jgi:hypothetical protein
MGSLILKSAEARKRIESKNLAAARDGTTEIYRSINFGSFSILKYNIFLRSNRIN